MFFIHMFIQQIFRFTPSSTLRANEKLIIARRVAIRRRKLVLFKIVPHMCARGFI